MGIIFNKVSYHPKTGCDAALSGFIEKKKLKLKSNFSIDANRVIVPSS
jgi:hypothetical protein